MKLHLVDGTYELFRAFYGAPGRRDSGGREAGATRALLSSLVSLLSEPDVTHVAVAFDHVIESFRNELFDGYKTGEGIDPDLYAQFGPAEDACRALGVVVWPMIEFEADDALASAAAQWSEQPQIEQVVLCSPDKDLYQCVKTDRVIVLDRLRRKIYDEPAVIAKLGIRPSSVPDYLALVGDSADGIPGIPRWGAKSASLMLAEYHHLESFPKQHVDWAPKLRGARALAGNLFDNWDDALLFRRLATLRTDVELGVAPEALVYRGPRDDEFDAVLDRLEYHALRERLRDRVG